ncbi:MAG: FHA domain-containing serine/threonine-protein kinase [Acidobacteriota bacterium]
MCLKLGRYEVLGEIGRGAMGVVYKGKDPIINRIVALKTMQLSYDVPQAELEDFQKRFYREAQTAGRLSHPNVVVIYHVGENFIAMEYVNGEPLANVMRRDGALSPERAIRILNQMCNVLDYAHSEGIVHRDVKPANILLAENDLVKVTDFGIAKVLSSSMTQTGKVLGTPRYMSPEQIGGEQVDGRSDIFSMGVIAYELLTGQSPFPGHNITSIVLKILNENPAPPSQLRQGLTAAVDQVFEVVLAKKRDERFPKAAHFHDALRAALAGAGRVGNAARIRTETQPAIDFTAMVDAEPAPEPEPEPPPPVPVRAAEVVAPEPGGRLVRDDGGLIAPLVFIAVSGPLVGERFVAKDLPITIGRGTARKNVLTITDESVSRKQATLNYSAESGELMLENESTTNISAANDVRAYKPLPVRRGDRITLGNTVLSVDLA